MRFTLDANNATGFDLYIAKTSREVSGTISNPTPDGEAEYHTDSDSGSDDDDLADGQLSD